MDWVQAADRETLKRIARTLIALAALADCASGRSRPVRCLVLCMLRIAETVARELLNDIRVVPLQPLIGAPFGCADGPDDALRLASNLRRMANALDGFLRHALGFALSKVGRGAPSNMIAEILERIGTLALVIGGAPTLCASEPHDTS